MPALESSHAIAYIIKLAPSNAERQEHRGLPFRPRGQGHPYRGRRHGVKF